MDKTLIIEVWDRAWNGTGESVEYSLPASCVRIVVDKNFAAVSGLDADGTLHKATLVGRAPIVDTRY
jgi:hypothetical protein